jgi:hypothetical protein
VLEILLVTELSLASFSSGIFNQFFPELLAFGSLLELIHSQGSHIRDFQN